MDEYAVMYWAAACLSLWAACGVSEGQMASAVDMVCDDARLSPPQEALLKRLFQEMS